MMQHCQHAYFTSTVSLDLNTVSLPLAECGMAMWFVSVCAVLPRSQQQVGNDCHAAVFVCQQDHVEIVLTALGAFWYLVYILWFNKYLLQEFRFLRK